MRPLPATPFQLESHLPSTFLLSVVVLALLATPQPSAAQWTEEGLQLGEGLDGITEGWLTVPDEEEGFWAVFTQYSSETLDRVYIQRYDRNGYPRWPGDGVRAFDPDIYYADGHMIGAWHNSDTSLTIAIGNHFAQGHWTIRGQRIGADGERLWGPVGSPASDTSGSVDLISHRHRVPNRDHLAVPTPQGGFYTSYERLGHAELRICGVTGDGHKRWPEGEDLDFGPIHSYPDPVFVEDRLGGTHVLFQRPEEDDDNLYHAHLLLDGSLESETPGIVWAPDDISHHIYFPYYPAWHPDGVGFVVSDNRLIQRANYSGVIMWDSSGVLHPDWRNSSVNEIWDAPIVFSDSSTAVVISHGLGMKVMRFALDGSLMMADTLQIDGDPYYHSLYKLTEIAGTDDFYFLSETRDLSEDMLFITAQRFNPNFESQFPTDTVIVHRNARIGGFRAATTSDNELLASAIHNNYREVYVWRVSEEGLVYGRDLAVEQRQADALQPDSPRIASSWPNPFNASVRLRCEIRTAGRYELAIYDLLGREVTRAAFDWHPGPQSWIWQPTATLPSGLYFARLQAQGSGSTSTVKLMLLR